MSFLAPVFLVAGAAVAAAIVLLHFLARQRPRAAMFPTARFVPDRPARSPSRAPRPTDWLLLALRVVAVIAIASAFAQPVRAPEPAMTMRLVLIDRSRAVADEGALRDSALATLRDGDIAIPFDTAARVVETNPRDSVITLARSLAPGSLSVALIAAERAAISLRDRADSIELAIVSPFASESWDGATGAIRSRWPGRIRLIPVPLARGDTTSRGIDVRAPSSDAVHAAAAPFLADGEPLTRIVRGSPTASDSMWARGAGHVLVHWPSASDTAMATAEAVVAREVVLVAPLVRYRRDGSGGGRVLARFSDGARAVVERAHGDGCLREVAFDLPPAGDVALRESARRLTRVVGGPCENHEPRAGLTMSYLDSLRGTGPLLRAEALQRPAQKRSAATSWLLLIGAALLLAELGVRQRTASV